MKVIYYKPEELNSECFLRFGSMTPYYCEGASSSTIAEYRYLTIIVANYNAHAVEAESSIAA